MKNSSKKTTIIGSNLINLLSIWFTKRYQPLHGTIADKSPETLARFGVGINGKHKQLAFIPAIEPDLQLQNLLNINQELDNAGLLVNFFILPDCTIIRPEIIDSADYGDVENGWVIRIYSATNDKPIITCLLNSENECQDVLKRLSERLKSSK